MLYKCSCRQKNQRKIKETPIFCVPQIDNCKYVHEEIEKVFFKPARTHPFCLIIKNRVRENKRHNSTCIKVCKKITILHCIQVANTDKTQRYEQNSKAGYFK